MRSCGGVAPALGCLGLAACMSRCGRREAYSGWRVGLAWREPSLGQQQQHSQEGHGQEDHGQEGHDQEGHGQKGPSREGPALALHRIVKRLFHILNSFDLFCKSYSTLRLLRTDLRLILNPTKESDSV